MSLISFCHILDDLKHLAAVKIETHTTFSCENSMSSFLMSAKSGDQVTQAFIRIASTLSGCLLPSIGSRLIGLIPSYFLNCVLHIRSYRSQIFVRNTTTSKNILRAYNGIS